MNVIYDKTKLAEAETLEQKEESRRRKRGAELRMTIIDILIQQKRLCESYDIKPGI